MIPPETVEAAKRADVEYVLGRVGIGSALKYGRYYRFNCPFHGSRDPDFMIDSESGWCKCHSAGCKMNKGTDLIGFVREITGVSFQEAIEIISGTVPVKNPVKVWKSEKTDDDKRKWMLDKFRVSRLPDGIQRANTYWSERGLSPKTIKDFGLGSFAMRGNEQLGTLSHYRNTIPWYTNGKMVCMSARRDDPLCRAIVTELDPEWVKVACGDEDPLKVLFGPKFLTFGGRNRDRIFNNQRVIKVVGDKVEFVPLRLLFITEGVGDVLAVESAGYPCISGRNSDLVAQALSRVERIIIIEDNDEAGNMYAQQIAQRIGRTDGSVAIATPPLKDAMDMLQAGQLRGWLESLQR